MNWDVQRNRKAVHDWVQKAELQPDGGANPNHAALDETVIRINNQQYWLYGRSRYKPIPPHSPFLYVHDRIDGDLSA